MQPLGHAAPHPKLTGGTFRVMEPITDIATYLRLLSQECNQPSAGSGNRAQP
jgi:hypothetical protein